MALEYYGNSLELIGKMLCNVPLTHLCAFKTHPMIEHGITGLQKTRKILQKAQRNHDYKFRKWNKDWTRELLDMTLDDLLERVQMMDEQDKILSIRTEELINKSQSIGDRREGEDENAVIRLQRKLLENKYLRLQLQQFQRMKTKWSQCGTGDDANSRASVSAAVISPANDMEWNNHSTVNTNAGGNHARKRRETTLISQMNTDSLLTKTKKLLNNIKRSSNDIINSITNETDDTIVQSLIQKYVKEMHLIDVEFVKQLSKSRDRNEIDSSVRKYVSQCSNMSHTMKPHPLALCIQEFKDSFYRDYDDKAAWINWKKAISRVKSLVNHLTETMGNKWNQLMLDFNSNYELLYLTRSKCSHAMHTDWKRSIYNHVLYMPLLNSVIDTLYERLIHIYSTQSQNIEITRQLSLLSKVITIEELQIQEPFSLPDETQPYLLAIHSLSKLNEKRHPEQLFQILLKMYNDIMDSVERVCALKSYNLETRLDQSEYFAVFLYVILKSNVENISSILDLIEDFMSPFYHLELEATFALTLLQATVEWSLEFGVVESSNQEDETDMDQEQHRITNNETMEQHNEHQLRMGQEEYIKQLLDEIQRLKQILNEKDALISSMKIELDNKEQLLPAVVNNNNNNGPRRKSTIRKPISSLDLASRSTKRKVLPFQFIVCEYISVTDDKVKLNGELILKSMSQFHNQPDLLQYLENDEISFDLFIKDVGRLVENESIRFEQSIIMSHSKMGNNGCLLHIKLNRKQWFDKDLKLKPCVVLRFEMEGQGTDWLPIRLKCRFHEEEPILSITNIETCDRFKLQWNNNSCDLSAPQDDSSLPSLHRRSATISDRIVSSVDMFEYIRLIMNPVCPNTHIQSVQRIETKAPVGRTLNDDILKFSEKSQCLTYEMKNLPVPYSTEDNCYTSFKLITTLSDYEWPPQSSQDYRYRIEFSMTNVCSISGIRLDGCEGKKPVLGSGELFLGGCKYVLQSGIYELQ